MLPLQFKSLCGNYAVHPFLLVGSDRVPEPGLCVRCIIGIRVEIVADICFALYLVVTGICASFCFGSGSFLIAHDRIIWWQKQSL